MLVEQKSKQKAIIIGVKILKMTIFFELIMEIKKKTFISNVFRYMYVKIASKWPQN